MSMKHQTLQYWITLPLKKILWTRISNLFSFFQVLVSFNEIFNPRCAFLEEKYYFPSGTLCCYLSWIMRGLILSQTPPFCLSICLRGQIKQEILLFFSFFFWLFLFWEDPLVFWYLSFDFFLFWEHRLVCQEQNFSNILKTFQKDLGQIFL